MDILGGSLVNKNVVRTDVHDLSINILSSLIRVNVLFTQQGNTVEESIQTLLVEIIFRCAVASARVSLDKLHVGVPADCLSHFRSESGCVAVKGLAYNRTGGEKMKWGFLRGTKCVQMC